MHRVSAHLSIALLALSCASIDYSNAPFCAPLAELAPLPDAECLDEPASRTFRDRLEAAMSDYVGAILVRVSLDDASHVASVCSETTQVVGGWRSRATLSERFDELVALEAGPPCLSGRRLDINRLAAMKAKIKKRVSECESDRDRAWEFRGCLDHDANWFRVGYTGRMDPYVFGWPQVVNPQVESSLATRNRCVKGRRFEHERTCIEEDGWELLE